MDTLNTIAHTHDLQVVNTNPSPLVSQLLHSLYNLSSSSLSSATFSFPYPQWPTKQRPTDDQDAIKSCWLSKRAKPPRLPLPVPLFFWLLSSFSSFTMNTWRMPKRLTGPFHWYPIICHTTVMNCAIPRVSPPPSSWSNQSECECHRPTSTQRGNWWTISVRHRSTTGEIVKEEDTRGIKRSRRRGRTCDTVEEEDGFIANTHLNVMNVALLSRYDKESLPPSSHSSTSPSSIQAVSYHTLTAFFSFLRPLHNSRSFHTLQIFSQFVRRFSSSPPAFPFRLRTNEWCGKTEC